LKNAAETPRFLLVMVICGWCQLSARHCERSEEIQNRSAVTVWICFTALALTILMQLHWKLRSTAGKGA
jgi:hypothetical protein